MNRQHLQAAVAKVIRLEALELAGIELSEEEVSLKNEARGQVAAAKSSRDPFVQGIRAVLGTWDGDA